MTVVKSSFRNLKVGDRVERWLDGTYWMDMEVIEISSDLLFCDAIGKTNGLRVGFTPSTGWRFDRDVGCEEDPDLKWGKRFKRTGSYLVLKEKAND